MRDFRWPMPKASAPSAPWVEVWLSPQTSQAGLGDALLRADDMGDALTRVAEIEELEAMPACIGLQGCHRRELSRIPDVREVVTDGRCAMIGCREDLVRIEHRLPLLVEETEGMHGTVMREVPAHVQQRLAIGILEDRVLAPDLLEQGARTMHRLHHR